METRQLSGELHNRIVTFLLSLPAMGDKQAQRALLNSAGLDEGLLGIIEIEGSPTQFFHNLIPNLVKYGKLADGRDALEAILIAAQQWGGPDAGAESAALIREWQVLRPPKPVNKPQDPVESLDTQILRVLYGNFQQKPGDPKMGFDEVLQALPRQQPQIIQTQLFALQTKGWVGYELTTTGDAGLIWIEPKGIMIAKQLKD